jgi:hypothetical protein
MGALSEEADSDYQVVVTADRIIERRTIRANCCTCNEEGVATDREAWQESRRERQHSRAVSARFYQTCKKSDSQGGRSGQAFPTRLMMCGLAGAAGLAMALWLALR